MDGRTADKWYSFERLNTSQIDYIDLGAKGAYLHCSRQAPITLAREKIRKVWQSVWLEHKVSFQGTPQIERYTFYSFCVRSSQRLLAC